MEDDKETDEHEEVEVVDEVELKKHLVIVKDDDIAIDAIPLATKPPVIVEYKLLKKGIIVHYQLIRADGSSKRYSSMIRMLKGIDREDLQTLWKLVKTNHGDTRPEDEHERVLFAKDHSTLELRRLIRLHNGAIRKAHKPDVIQFRYSFVALKLTPFYNAFEISAVVPKIYMQEFWVIVSRHHSSLHFKLNGKSHTVNVDNFRDMLKICPKLSGQIFEEPPLEEEILSFIRDLGHTGEIKFLSDVNVNHMHQP
ncbi:hypothetical protein Tco_0722498 [Tanacetum coccineum]